MCLGSLREELITIVMQPHLNASYANEELIYACCFWLLRALKAYHSDVIEENTTLWE